ncbi:MAG: hypothetical protein Q8L01_02435, partial [Candidatus Woesebacteria bacterium]|nr:hypothetical protein [Candidatus Woesebacteria bacterium]
QNCRTKDTAMALIAFNTLSKENLDPSVDWIKGSLVSSNAAGSWLLEVTTENSGACKLSYEFRNQTQEVVVQVEKGKFPTCGNSNFYDLNNCMANNVIRNNPSLDLTVDCSALTGQSIISLVYKVQNTFYILSSTVANSALVKVSNGCFGRARGDACDKVSTMYANWALKALKSDVDTTMYVRSVYDKLSLEDNALLYLTSKDPTLAQQVKTLQLPDGSWERSVQKTSLALIVLNDDPVAYEREITKAKSWLATRQRADGSLNGNALDTAMALYSIGEIGGTPLEPGTCTDGVQNQDERGVDCGGACTEDDCCSNNVLDDQEEGTDCGGLCTRECTAEETVCNNDNSCDRFAGESESNCPNDCQTTSSECVVNADCESSLGETAVNCPDDCSCGDSVCDNSESPDSCSQDCGGEEPSPDVVPPVAKPAAKKSNLGTIIIILLVLGILGAGGYFAYKRGLLKFPSSGSKPQAGSRPEYKPFTSRLQQQPQRQAQPARQAAPAQKSVGRSTDDELEKSLEEAKKLLRK